MRWFFLLILWSGQIFAALPDWPDFEKAMGKKTTAWSHIRTPEDKRLFAHFKKKYEDAQKSEDRAIPPILHWIWLGPSPFPQDSIDRMKKWIEIHPGWIFNLWTDQKREQIPLEVVVRDPLEALSGMKGCYFACDNFGERSEILRLSVLSLDGGIYLDHDVEPLRPLTSLMEGFDFFCGLEVLKPTVLSSSIYPATHLIGAAAHHPILALSLEWLKSHWDALEEAFPGKEEKEIINRVKHRSFRALQKGIQEEGQSAFSPILPASFFSEDHPEKGVYAIHHHLGTWFSKQEEVKMREEIFSLERKVSISTWMVIALSFCNGGIGLFLLQFLSRKKYLIAVALSVCLGTQGFSLERTPDYHDFFSLMGKNTEHWKYVSLEGDLLLLDRIEELYQRNKEAQFTKEGAYRIPPVIHLIWLGPKAFPSGSIENLRSWIAYHPEWRIKLWTDRERETPCEGVEMIDIGGFAFRYLGNCFQNSSNWGEKSDLLRYEILLAEGGIYVDHDAYCIASFEGLVRGYDFFCCLEPPHEPFVGRNITCWNGLIGARPEHPLLLETIRKVEDSWQRIGDLFCGKDLYSQVEVVMQRTYIAFTNALEKSLDLSENRDIVFPASYFFAKGKMPSIYSKHFCHTTWDGFKFRKSAPEKLYEKVFKKICNENKRLLYLAGGSLLLSFLFLGYAVLRITRC
ncbi:MAG: hypothetical protein HYZ48_01755 [Chlamydiales bacterium]|nr:hypothetical protein [Chlamydiales bacterium]